MCARADTGVVSLVSQSVSGHFLLMRTRGRRFRPPTSIIHSLHLYLSLHLLLLAAALSAITSSTIDKGIPSDTCATSSRPSANFHHLFTSSLSVHLLLLAAARSAITSSTINKGIPSDARTTLSRPSAKTQYCWHGGTATAPSS